MEYENKNSHRGKGRGRGRGRKKNAENECKTQEIIPNLEERNESEPVTLDMDADITQLEAPTFSTINKGPPEPMLRLKWDHKTHLIGEKVINPMIHCCDKCDLPISIYGRMIPCKHVFCLLCAERENKVCPRCQEKVVRIEKTGLGTVFMCTFGGTRYGNTGCRRTYLSQRDLQAHINHRHVSNTVPMKENMNTQVLSLIKTSVPSSNRPKIMPPTHHAVAGDPRIQNATNEYYHKMHSPSSHSTSSSQHPSHSGSRQPQQFHHHSSNGNHHHERTQHSSQSHSVNPHSAQLQSTPHHLSMSNSQSVLQPPEFPSSLMVPNYPPPSTGTVTSTNLRSNLITVQIHDSNPDSVNSSMGIPMAAGFSHQTFSSQFTQNSSTSMATFPVPPPSQLPTIGQISQSHPQFFSGSPANYTTTPPQRSLNNFNSNQTSSLISQPMMSNRTPPIVPPPRRPQFSGEPVMQPFPVPPPHRWHPPPNQTHFY